MDRIPEPECSQFIAATRAHFMAERNNSIRQRLAAAKVQEQILQGHDLSGKERFHPETRHMIMLEVQKWCFVGFKEERGLCCRSGRRRTNVHWTLCALRTAEDFHRFLICSNHHREGYRSSALTLPATPLWTCYLKIFQKAYSI